MCRQTPAWVRLRSNLAAESADVSDDHSENNVILIPVEKELQVNYSNHFKLYSCYLAVVLCQ